MGKPCVDGRTYALLSCVHLAEIASRQERERERGPIALKYEWGLDAANQIEGGTQIQPCLNCRPPPGGKSQASGAPVGDEGWDRRGRKSPTRVKTERVHTKLYVAENFSGEKPS